MTDLDVLVRRWQSADERAAVDLYERCLEPVYRLAYGLLGDAAEAEEAAQDALAYAFEHIARYDPERSRFTTWLHTITVSRCRDRYRRRRPTGLSLTDWLHRGGDVADPAPGPEQQAVRREAHGEVWEAVQALPPPLREAILLRHWSGHTYREMAEVLGCPLRTAQSRVRLAYRQLRAALAPAHRVGLELEKGKRA